MDDRNESALDRAARKWKAVYTIVERNPERRHWLRIGIAFVNRDGSLNVRLDAIPANGQLHHVLGRVIAHQGAQPGHTQPLHVTHGAQAEFAQTGLRHLPHPPDAPQRQRGEKAGDVRRGDRHFGQPIGFLQVAG